MTLQCIVCFPGWSEKAKHSSCHHIQVPVSCIVKSFGRSKKEISNQVSCKVSLLTFVICFKAPSKLLRLLDSPTSFNAASTVSLVDRASHGFGLQFRLLADCFLDSFWKICLLVDWFLDRPCTHLTLLLQPLFVPTHRWSLDKPIALNNYWPILWPVEVLLSSIKWGTLGFLIPF